jgi:acyl carrier protein
MSTYDKVRAIAIEELQLDEDEVTPESDLFDDLGADSLDHVELTMALEETFGIEIADEEIEGETTIGGIAKVIDNILTRQKGGRK